MTISKEILGSHSNKWRNVFSSSNYPFRVYWVDRLFRHEPIENAAEILKSGFLFSRTHSIKNNVIINDIAPQSIISQNRTAHAYARLYFRPLNPTQYWIEGIRAESYHQKQAPVLVMFTFKSESILTTPNILFSNANMQSEVSNVFSGDQNFLNLPFNFIYHHGPVSEDKDAIIKSRCAEVLVPEKLDVKENIEYIICRSPAERYYLMYLLGEKAKYWSSKIKITSKPGIFHNTGLYLDKVQVLSDRIEFSFHPGEQNHNISVEIWTKDSFDNKLIILEKSILSSHKNWYTPFKFNNGYHYIGISINDYISYQGLFLVNDLPF
jgi:hypothetical protein